MGDGSGGGANQDGVWITSGTGNQVSNTAIYIMGGSGVRVAQTATGNATVINNVLGAPAWMPMATSARRACMPTSAMASI